MNKTILSAALFALFASPAFSEEPATLPTADSAQPATPAVTTQQPIDCNYKISAETTEIDPAIIKTWGKQATVQAFSLNASGLDNQMDGLKTCFTEQGWKGFRDALEESGNIKAIQSQNLTVSSQVNGPVNLTSAKDNQWKLSIPLEVVYQNDKQKLTQLLSVDVLVGRKVSGDLGIMQMIATPQVADKNNTSTQNSLQKTTDRPVSNQPSSASPTAE